MVNNCLVDYDAVVTVDGVRNCISIEDVSGLNRGAFLRDYSRLD